MSATSPTPAGPSRGQPLRRKIEYVPLARDVESAGGRDVQLLQSELLRLARGRPLRDINEWGKVHVDALMMSLRSRISTELSYSLTTITILSTMRGNTPDSGFPVSQCEELLDEILDFLEETAFNGVEDNDVAAVDAETQVMTHRQLIQHAQDAVSFPFAEKKRMQGDFDPTAPGPVQRKGDLVRVALTILRNFSAVPDNQTTMAQHPTLPDLLLRTTGLRVDEDGSLRPASSVLTVPDLIAVRKEVLHTFVNLAGAIQFAASSSPTPIESRRARRVFELASSYLSDIGDSLAPVAWIVHSGLNLGPHVRAPLLADAALEVFTRISQPDANRQVLSSAIPKTWMWRLFEMLMHRLPAIETDFQLALREDSWMSYIEKTVLSLYSLGFLMPPELKKKVKTDRSICFAKVMLRLVKKFMMTSGNSQNDSRMYFYYCARRAIEAMKVIDNGDDSFDSTQPSMPQLSFGVGYGEVGDNLVEKGTGLLGGYREDVRMMMQINMDEVMFAELESLARVEADAS